MTFPFMSQICLVAFHLNMCKHICACCHQEASILRTHNFFEVIWHFSFIAFEIFFKNEEVIYCSKKVLEGKGFFIAWKGIEDEKGYFF